MKAAVIGLGYVGLPLTIRLSQLNFDVSGIDINFEKIRKLQKGILPFAESEPWLNEYFIKEFKKGKLSFSSTFEKLAESKIIFVCVDTPIIGKTANYRSFKNALKSIGRNLKKDSIVVIESTVAPNTSIKIAIPIIERQSGLEKNKDFFVATVPERIRPNHIFEQLTSLSRVIGVSDNRIKKTLKRIYSRITSGEIDFTDLTTAETVKTVENSFRDVNIAFANEVAIACEELGVDVWKVIELVNKSPFHNMHTPGAGVGGHCIPKDPWLLAFSVKKNQLPIIKNARNTNDNMPNHIFSLTKKALKEKNIDIANSNLAILGYSYIGNSDDTRNSPTEQLEKILKRSRIKYKIQDPFVEKYSKLSVYEVAKSADAIVLMVAHDVYRKIDLKKLLKIMKSKVIIDGRNFFEGQKMVNLGFVYKGIGNTALK